MRKSGPSCGGRDLRLIPNEGYIGAGMVRRREVSLTRGVSVTSERNRSCEALRTVTPKAPKFVLRRAGEGK